MKFVMTNSHHYHYQRHHHHQNVLSTLFLELFFKLKLSTILKLILFLLLLMNYPIPCHQNRITSKIYTDLDNRYFCFVLLNATHQIGCASKPFFVYLLKFIKI